jgi:hypothetical protein
MGTNRSFEKRALEEVERIKAQERPRRRSASKRG